MSKGGVEPIRGKRYIGESTAHDLIHMVLSSAPLPFCHHAAATHITGSSLAGLAARAMRANLNFFRDQVDICWMELMCERDHTPAKLSEHLGILGSLNLLFFSLTADRDVDVGGPVIDDRSEKANVMAQAFARLPQDDLRAYNECIILLRHLLENEILLKMMNLSDTIDFDPQSDWENTIRSLLHLEVGPVLERMHRKLTDLLPDVLSPIVEKARADFEDDMIQIGRDGHAR